MTSPATAPGRFEHGAMWVALFVLTAGMPFEWSRVAGRGEVIGGDTRVAAFFILISGFLAIQMNGRWPEVLRVLGREPVMLMLLGWTALSFIWSDAPDTTIRRSVAVIVTSYVGAHLVLRFSQFQILRMVASVLAAVAMVNLSWILLFPQWSGPRGGGIGPDADERLTGIYTHPNPLGRAMALAVFTLLAAYKLDRRRRPAYAVSAAVAMVVLTLSESKTALVVAVLTTTLLFVYLVFRARRTLFGAVAVSMIGAGAASVFLVVNNLGLLTSWLGRDVSLTGRVPLWQDLIPIALERPVFGHGYDAFWLGWGSPAQEVWNEHPWLPPHGHNEFLDVTLDLGLVGLVLYAVMLYRTALRATRYVRDVPTVFGLWPLTFVSFYLSASITESGIFNRDITWAFLVGTVVLMTSKNPSVDRRHDPSLLVEPPVRT